MGSNDAKGATPNIMTINTNAGVPDAWLKMQESTRRMTAHMMPDVSKMMPDMSKYAMPQVLSDSTLMRMSELSQQMADVAALRFPVEDMNRLQKLVTQQTAGLDTFARQFAENQAAFDKMLEPTRNMLKMASYNDQIQKSVEAMASSFAAQMDTSRIQDLLATASTLRQGLTDEDVEELTDEFYTAHPDIAESVEASPLLWTLSRTDRMLIVWLVGVIVTLYVGNALLYISTDFPELKTVIDAFGLDFGGGVDAGIATAAATNEALKKLPQSESD
ncbi:hypothetical protein J2X12_004138 [Pseudarthrobacter oxydans]|uniref:Uncharacterized protein n=1 Tax=Pseudarthrobacter oxydans TaxID=1671 RepID=A0AAW8NHP2_PSEOX|nr:hypothetical protein [Pseudarthrobacter oxydans]MDR6794714.1 hypothetical protein [Pseudarthrobacter oxydans]MDR7166084.1 hypothetical protein [Pseudarthrobacter oxydans]